MAAVGSFSSLQLVAGAAILGNVNGPAFRPNAAVGPLMEQYTVIIQPVTISWSNTLSALAVATSANVPVIDTDTANAVIREIAGNATISVLTGNLPGSGQKITSASWANLYTNTAQALNVQNVENKLDPVYGAIAGYVVEQNQLIFSAVNASNPKIGRAHV